MYFTQQEVLMGRKNGSETMKPATFKEKHENLHISSCKRYVDKYLTYQKHPALSILLDLLLLKPGLNIKGAELSTTKWSLDFSFFCRINSSKGHFCGRLTKQVRIAGFRTEMLGQKKCNFVGTQGETRSPLLIIHIDPLLIITMCDG
jgi:hypothetical protein